MANGLAFDREGRLLCCEHATSRLTRHDDGGRATVLASHHDGRELNSPNDVVVKSDGAIYFTDPTYGRNPYYGVPRDPVLGFRGVYRVNHDGTHLTLLADDFAQPNGLCFSLDERRLYVNDTERMHIRAFDLRADGTLAGGAVWAQVSGEGDGAPDGMKIDRDGHVWCCGPGGIHVFDAGAHCLGVLRVPTPTANFAFGGDDARTLFVTATGTLWRARVRTPGHLPLALPAGAATPSE
jgi:gluconolactonase